MRIAAITLVTAVLLASASFASDSMPSAPAVVHLDGPKSLAALRSANPSHYARAQRIIAAANELCRPGPLESYFARFAAREISCADMLFKTSNPPKKELAFRLDDTRYLALVTVTDAPAKAVPLVR